MNACCGRAITAAAAALPDAAQVRWSATRFHCSGEIAILSATSTATNQNAWDAGCSNYSMFMKGEDLFAYMEVTDFERFKQRMATQRREAYMARIMDCGILPETGFHEVLPEVFHLD